MAMVLGYSIEVLGRKGKAVMYVVSLRRSRADNGVRATKTSPAHRVLHHLIGA